MRLKKFLYMINNILTTSNLSIGYTSKRRQYCRKNLNLGRKLIGGIGKSTLRTTEFRNRFQEQS
jgi:hypothetical protein